MRSDRRGFSLVEFLLVMALLAILLGLGVMSGRRGNERTESRGMAQLLAEELKLARDRAVSTGVPVAVVFPSQNGGLPVTQSFYQLEGQQPRMQRVANLAVDFPDAYVFNGHWSVPGGHQANADLPAGNHEDFDLTTWGQPTPLDYHFVFLPSGTVVSDRVAFDDAFHLVVCAGAGYAAGTAAGVPSFSLSEVQAPYTVTIQTSGEIQTSPGLLAGGSVSETGVVTAVGAAPPAMPVAGNNPPENLQVEIFPAPVPDNLPTGVDATVKQGGYLTFVVRADDPDGDPLNSVWSTADGGHFSSAVAVEMRYEGGRWESVWEWRPPDDAVAGDQYTLTVSVADDRGGVVTGNVGATGTVQVLPRGRIVYESDIEDPNREIYTMNADGTDVTRLTFNTVSDQSPRWSYDGSMITFRSDRNGAEEVFVMQADGSGQRPVVPAAVLGAQTPGWPTFSPSGALIAFETRGAGITSYYLVRVDGTHPDTPGTPGIKLLAQFPGVGLRGLTWHPDGTRIIVSGGPVLSRVVAPAVGFGGADLYEIYLDGSPPVNLTQTPTIPDYEPHLRRQGDRLAWNQPQGVIALANYGGALPLSPTTYNNAPNESPVWSPLGDQFTVQGNPGAGIREVYIRNEDGSQVQRLTTENSDCDNSDWTLR